MTDVLTSSTQPHHISSLPYRPLSLSLCVFIFLFLRKNPSPVHRHHSPGFYIIHIGPFAFHIYPPSESSINWTEVEPPFTAVPLLLRHCHIVNPYHLHIPGIYFSLSSRHHFSFLFNPFYSKSSLRKCKPASFMAAGAQFHFQPPRTNAQLRKITLKQMKSPPPPTPTVVVAAVATIGHYYY